MDTVSNNAVRTQQNISGAAVPVALLKYKDGDALRLAVGSLLDASQLPKFVPLRLGARVLVKPNLLMANTLACTTPEVVAAACAWLLDYGAQVRVADSPGFGRAGTVARRVGLTEALRPLGLKVESMGAAPLVSLPLQDLHSVQVRFHVARCALESDFLLSMPRVKAHSQMLLTLSVKNCFGCVPGLHKAVAHAREGRDPLLFAECLAALWAVLPPVAALADGITAMHETGPSKGKPFPLGLLGASASAVALDETLYAILGKSPTEVPLGAALTRRKAWGTAAAGTSVAFPLLYPKDIDATGFCLPTQLAHTSFHPTRFVRSCVRRIMAALQR
ncbi:MAG: DUF362 domain-containing protein [Desulfovibrio sp.]|nr:DUF362 domain-containing protein [Desulfovibrio sp.]